MAVYRLMPQCGKHIMKVDKIQQQSTTAFFNNKGGFTMDKFADEIKKIVVALDEGDKTEVIQAFSNSSWVVRSKLSDIEDIVKKRIKEFKYRSQYGKVDWGWVGDMNAVKEGLEEILEMIK